MMGPHSLDSLDLVSHAIEALTAAATFPLLVLLAMALIVLAVDAVREHVAAKQPRSPTRSSPSSRGTGSRSAGASSTSVAA